jgi:hypothetical protein
MSKYYVKSSEGVIEHTGTEQECRQYIQNVKDLWGTGDLELFVKNGKEETRLG